MKTLRLLAAIIAVSLTVAPAKAAPIAQQQWQADIDYLADQLPKVHPNLYHALTVEQLKTAIDDVKRTRVQSREDEIVAVMRLVALIQDAHNEVEFPCGDGNATNYPLRLRWFPQGVLVEAAPAQYASLVGGTIEAIDDTPIDRAWTALLPLVSHDANNVEGGLQAHPTIYLTCSGILHALHITHASDSATYTVRVRGNTLHATLTPAVSWLTTVRPITVTPADNWVEAGPAHPPLWLSHPRDMFWFAYLGAERTLYVQINNVLDSHTEALAHFSSRLFAAIANNKAQRLVLDLRRTTGGDNTLLRPLVVGLIQAQTVNRPGGFFVLTSHATYSAAQNLSNRLQNYTNAVFIGQPTADNVNFYADTKPIVLPNSHIEVHISHLYWQDDDPRDHRAALYPDVAVDPSLDAFLRGEDLGLEAALSYKLEKTLEERLRSSSRFGYERAYADYRAFLQDPRHEYVHGVEARLNALGYQLLFDKAYAQAVVVFRINTTENPNSSNAWDSLGDGYAAQHLKSDAIAAYRHSLRIDPSNADASRCLEELNAAQTTKQ